MPEHISKCEKLEKKAIKKLENKKWIIENQTDFVEIDVTMEQVNFHVNTSEGFFSANDASGLLKSKILFRGFIFLTVRVAKWKSMERRTQ